MAIFNSYVSLPEGKSCGMFINYWVSHIDKSPLNFKKRLNFIIFRPSLWDSWLYFMRFHPYFVYITRFLVTHFWWRSPQQKHVQLPRARLRDPAAARLSRAPLRVCTPHRSPSAVLYFGRQKLVGSGSPLPRKTIKSQGFNWVDCSWLSIDTEEIPWVFTVQGELRDAAQVVFPLQSKRKGMCRPRRTDEDKWVQEICSKVGGIEVDSIGTCSQRLW